ncbi:MAG: imidazolonepropionase [Armatimonadetes bacterium 13_1_40CM_3_65_7]|nr:MAG: imidazolonepropionase [Armatimonadetes bacterium 13_1_40CM_3_65_7]
MRSDLLVVSASQLITAPPGEGPLLGPDLDRPLLVEDAAVACVQGKIAAVGKTSEVRALYPEREAGHVVDARGLLLAPGFVDAHTHLPFAGTREMEFDARARGESYAAIAARGGGIRASVRHLRAVSEESLGNSISARLKRLLAQGTTTVEAKSGYGLSLEEERKQLRALRRAAESSPVEVIPTFLGAHEVPDEYRDRREEYVSLLRDSMIPEIAKERLARFCDVFCDQGVFTVEESRRILARARECGLGIKLHADELADVGAASLAAELRAVSADHLLHASPEGLRAMAEARVVAVLLPGTAFTLGLPYARARVMVEMGLAVALATDFNPGSNMSSSMPMAMTLAVTQMKVTPAEAWMASTVNAACAVGEGGRLGRIQAGYEADLVLFDASDHRQIAYHYAEEHVRMVIKKGALAMDRAESYKSA